MTAAVVYLREFNFVSVVFRLVLALASGGIIGYGRAKKERNAGLRTYMLVSIGAALTVILSLYEYEMLYGPWLSITEFVELKFDASRYAAQVITGIGFLAAGTIIAVEHQQVSGLTSAIGLFAAACLGLAAGAGFYECVIIAALLIVFAMEAMQPMEVRYKRRLRNITLCVEFDSVEDVGSITNEINSHGAKIYDIDFERVKREGELFPSAIFTLKLDRENPSHSEMLSAIAEMPCVYSIQELIS